MLISPLAPPPGGIATWTEGLLRFSSQDSDVEIVHVDSAVRYRSVVNTGLTARVIVGFFHSIILFAKFLVTLLSKSVDVTHICTSGSFGMYRDLIFIAFSRFLRVPVVLHLRFGRIPTVAISRNWEASLIKTACKLATCVIVLEPASAKALRLLAPGCFTYVIPNPAWKLDEVSVTPVDQGEVKAVVFVGHVTPNKGARELVLACGGIKDTKFRLDLIGPVEDRFRDELHALASVGNDGGWLNISGQVKSEEALTKMSSGLAVILPSYTEGFPNVLLEAMMLGKPVIATSVGAIPQMLSEGGAEPCGICVPVGDVDALRMAVQSLLEQPRHASELGQRGRERVAREYSPRMIYSQYKSLWKKSAFQL